MQVSDEVSNEVSNEAKRKGYDFIASLLNSSNSLTKPIEKQKRIKLLCNWCSSESLTELWKKMSKDGRGCWENIQLVNEEPDYYVIINSHGNPSNYVKEKTVIFHMEPNIPKHPEKWFDFSNPEGFLSVQSHNVSLNIAEWHLSKSYLELSRNQEIRKIHDNCISTVLSGKYADPGHIKRVDFVKYLEDKIPVHVYGENKWGYKDYKGALPYHCKDDGLFPYKYTFNAENHSIPNYFTEKLIDGILSETLVFYWGCPNIREIIDPRAYVELSLFSFEKDAELIKKAIEEDWYTQRLPYIRTAKKKILEELQFFPKVKRVLES